MTDENEKVYVTHVMLRGGGMMHVEGERLEVVNAINNAVYHGYKFVDLDVQSVDGFDTCTVNLDAIWIVADDHVINEEPGMPLPPKDIGFVQKAENTTEVVL